MPSRWRCANKGPSGASRRASIAGAGGKRGQRLGAGSARDRSGLTAAGRRLEVACRYGDPAGIASGAACQPPSQASTPTPFAADLAALAWQVELGADEAIGETPVDRFELGGAAPVPRGRAGGGAGAPRPAPADAGPGGAASWRRPARDLAALRAAMDGVRGLRAEAGGAEPRLRRRQPARRG